MQTQNQTKSAMEYRTEAERLQWIQAATPEQIRDLEDLERQSAERKMAMTKAGQKQTIQEAE